MALSADDLNICIIKAMTNVDVTMTANPGGPPKGMPEGSDAAPWGARNVENATAHIDWLTSVFGNDPKQAMKDKFYPNDSSVTPDDFQVVADFYNNYIVPLDIWINPGVTQSFSIFQAMSDISVQVSPGTDASAQYY